MSDWLDRVIALAEGQGFTVRQRTDGKWVFWRAGVRVLSADSPRGVRAWVGFIAALRAAGMDLEFVCP
ncbi:hypothetical protein ACIGO9_28635 [Nocardia asteroides]|uniref:hypothetical protein n=1 Tax=Nocardia asteroides TaxID=1824 RepID=UPI0037C9088C